MALGLMGLFLTSKSNWNCAATPTKRPIQTEREILPLPNYFPLQEAPPAAQWNGESSRGEQGYKGLVCS